MTQLGKSGHAASDGGHLPDTGFSPGSGAPGAAAGGRWAERSRDAMRASDIFLKEI